MNQIPTTTAGRLRRLNGTFGLLHLVSGVAMVLLSNDFSIGITTSFAEGPPGSGTPQPDVLFDLPLGLAVAAFVFMSALAHFVIVSPWGFPRYVEWLSRGKNPMRWVEYSFSASLMIVLIALLPGITDIAALVALFGVNAAMILFGWLMEDTNVAGSDDVDWKPFVFGSIAGVVPWIAIGIYLFGAGSDVPDFVYVIFFTIFVFFNSFAVNQWLQYRGVGKWRDYVFGEKVYVWLSLGAKLTLAWQIFANTLID